MHNSFDCIFYYVHAFDRSITFYTDVLGLKFESRDDVVRLRLEGVLIELVQAPDSTGIEEQGTAAFAFGFWTSTEQWPNSRANTYQLEKYISAERDRRISIRPGR